MKHSLIRDQQGFTCSVCQWSWRIEPVSDCPGVPQYEWGAAPESLLTKNQLAKRKLNPGPVRGMVGGWSLYELAEAVPYTDEQIAALRAKQRERRHRAKLRREQEEQKYLEWLKAQIKRRDAAIIWARALLAEGTAFILDTETTGLGFDAEIVAIAIVDLRGKLVLESLIKPNGVIEPEAIAVHGITAEMVDKAPGFDWIYSQLVYLLPGRTVVCYNAEFDARMLAQSARRLGFLASDFLERTNCAMEMYADYIGEWSDKYGRNKWQKLPGGDHTARGDALATLALILHMAEQSTNAELSNG
jgi:DNA polymerase III subunit epsilon